MKGERHLGRSQLKKTSRWGAGESGKRSGGFMRVMYVPRTVCRSSAFDFVGLDLEPSTSRLIGAPADPSSIQQDLAGFGRGTELLASHY